MKKILVIMLFLLIPIKLFSEGKNMNNKMEIKLEYRDRLLLSDSQPIRKFKLVKEAKLCQGTYMTLDKSYYLERASDCHPSPDDFVTKEEYDKNPKIILDEKGREIKDIFIKFLPKGTELELVGIVFDAGALFKCHYWIKLLNDKEYGEVLIDAVALTEVEDNWLITGWWNGFIESKEINGGIKSTKIKVNKVPMFKSSWAKEIK